MGYIADTFSLDPSYRPVRVTAFQALYADWIAARREAADLNQVYANRSKALGDEECSEDEAAELVAAAARAISAEKARDGLGEQILDARVETFKDAAYKLHVIRMRMGPEALSPEDLTDWLLLDDVIGYLNRLAKN